MNSLELQDAILKAVDTLTQKRMERIQADRTITAQVLKCTNALTKEYSLEYNGGNILAYAADGKTYSNGEVVYVLVPQGDFSANKVILDKGQAKKDSSQFVGSALNNYNIIGRNLINDAFNSLPLGLHSYLNHEYALLYKYGIKSDAANKMFLVDGDELSNSIKESDGFFISADFLSRLPRAHRISSNGTFGLEFILAYKDQSKENGIKLVPYIIDTNNMVGNPLNNGSWTTQQQIYAVDKENFLYIDTILFYERDFVVEDDLVNADDKLGHGKDIFVKNIQFMGLKKIAATSGNYRLQILTPKGNTFKTLNSSSNLDITAKFYMKNTNLTDQVNFYWFKEDNRITTLSKGYQMYGGPGWKLLEEKGHNNSASFPATENLAHENKYLLVAVYKEQIVLKEHFVLFNEASKREISINSSLGVKFNFDLGTPTLTCLINGKEENFDAGIANAHPDQFFTFVWSKVDKFGNVTIFNQTKQEVEEKYNNLLHSGNFTYAELTALKNLAESLNGISWEKNKLIFPVNKIDDTVTIKCSVYLQDREPVNEETAESLQYNIGSSSIVLQNEKSPVKKDYQIVIENGNQVFQYSESGVSPANERNQSPTLVKPLIAHLYDPNGLEVNSSTFEIEWLVPVSNSLIELPSLLQINPASGVKEIFNGKQFPLKIKDIFDSLSYNNQIQAIVKYQGQIYRQLIDLTFTKVGENGTNGTDIVAKLSPSFVFGTDKKLCLEIENGKAALNSGQTLDDEIFNFNLFQKNEKLIIEKDKIQWNILGGNKKLSKVFDFAGNKLTYTPPISANNFRNQIIKTSYKLEDKEYSACYPLAIIDYRIKKNYQVDIVASKTLDYILYNREGRNPLYNHNLGVFINIESKDKKYIVWSAEGGEPDFDGRNYADHPKNSDLNLSYDKDSNSTSKNLIPRVTYDEHGNATGFEQLTQIYISPNVAYSGKYSNNLVYGRIYNSKEDFDNSRNPEVEIYIPIHLSFNTFGLASLNGWDGNRLEINQNENYILAPQMGAGYKDANNRFTGLVMGSSSFYDKKGGNTLTGLLGFSKGKQSIFLDAETGSAIFGLPEEQSDENKNYESGQIKLIPGEESSIGNWHIGSTSLYNIEPNKYRNGNVLDKPYADLAKVIDKKTKKPRYKASIPHDAEGIMLSSAPAYITIKGRSLIDNDKDANFSGSNTIIQPKDSFELQLDPNNPSIFTIYRHTNAAEYQNFVVHENNIYTEEDVDFSTPLSSAILDSNSRIIGWETKEKFDGNYVIAHQLLNPDSNTFSGDFYFSLVKDKDIYYLPEQISSPAEKDAAARKLANAYKWHRELKVGINSQGRFFTNALKDNATALAIGDIGAFGEAAAKHKYIGATFNVGTGTNDNGLIKFFTESKSVNKKSGTLYMTGGTSLDNEYQRDFVSVFSSIGLYVSNTKSINKTSRDRIIISSDSAEIGHENTFLSLPATEKSLLVAENGLDITTSLNKAVNIVSGQLLINLNSNSSQLGGLIVNASGNTSLNTGKKLSINVGSKDFVLNTLNTEIKTSNEGYTARQNENGVSRAGLDFKYGPGLISNIWGEGLLVKSNRGILHLESHGSPDGVQIDAYSPSSNSIDDGVYLRLLPQTGGSASSWILSSPNGTMKSTNELYHGFSGISTSGIFNPNSIYVPGVINSHDSTKGVDYWTSIMAGWDIRSANGSFIAGNDFKFAKTYAFSGYSGYDSVYNHLKAIYAELANFYNKINNLRTDVDNHWAVTATERYADNAANRAYNNATTWTANQNYATQNWVYSNYTPWNTYRAHTHKAVNVSNTYGLVDWDTYNSAVGDITHVKRTAKLSDLYTGGPA